ncbi:MAG: aldo/keto reductase [Spirochaetota bacterium]
MTLWKLWDDPVIDEFASAHDKSRAQGLLRWNLPHGVVTIPKSVHKERIRENAEIFDFELTDVDMSRPDAFDRGERIGPDPARVVIRG